MTILKEYSKKSKLQQDRDRLNKICKSLSLKIEKLEEHILRLETANSILSGIYHEK